MVQDTAYAMSIGFFTREEFRSAASRPEHTSDGKSAFLTDCPYVSTYHQIFVNSIGAIVPASWQKGELRNIRAHDGEP